MSVPLVVEFIKRNLDICNVLLSAINVIYVLRVQRREQERVLCGRED